MKIAKVQIKTPDDLAVLNRAIGNYNAKIQREATDPRYIKQFSTFMGCWRDYLEAPTTTGQLPLRSSTAPVQPSFATRADCEDVAEILRRKIEAAQ